MRAQFRLLTEVDTAQRPDNSASFEQKSLQGQDMMAPVVLINTYYFPGKVSESFKDVV